MIVVIQCAARKRPDAGHLKSTDGRQVIFVADPDSAPAQSAPDRCVIRIQTALLQQLLNIAG